MSTDLDEVLADVSTCITASMGVGVLWKGDLSIAWSCNASPSACSVKFQFLDGGKYDWQTLQPTRTMGAWGLRRRTKGNQEVASASKDDLAITLDACRKWSKYKKTCRQLRSKVGTRLPGKDRSMCVWSVAGEVNTMQ